jgi:hypothetical protein
LEMEIDAKKASFQKSRDGIKMHRRSHVLSMASFLGLFFCLLTVFLCAIMVSAKREVFGHVACKSKVGCGAGG